MGPEIWWLEDNFTVVARPIVRGYTIVCVSNTEGAGFLLLILIFWSPQESGFACKRLPVQWSKIFELETTHLKGDEASKLCCKTSINDMQNMICQQQNLLCHVITAMFRLLFTSWPVKSQPLDVWCLRSHMAGTNKRNSHPHITQPWHFNKHVIGKGYLQKGLIAILRILVLSKTMPKYSIPAQSFQGWQRHILS